MRKIVLALAAAAVATLLSACAGGTRSARTPDQGGHATQDGAAFMGYHGPAWRANSPAD
jgi:hypothetical protein